VQNSNLRLLAFQMPGVQARAKISQGRNSMRLRKQTAYTLFAIFLANTCEAAIRIQDDSGGPLGDYILRFSNVSRSGEQIVIDGRCYSACTTVIGLVPAKRICVTPRAVLGFHAALAPDHMGKLVVDPDATRVMYDIYPKRIRDWLKINGGLDARMIYLSGADLAKLYARCRR
jgi:hypothetical protein